MFLQALRRRGAPIAVLCFAAFTATFVPPRKAGAQETNSDPTDVTPASHGVGGAGTLGQAPPGAGSGDALIHADPSTGAALASLPFQLEHARGDGQPTLALQYNSSSGPGLGGMGWSLNLPSIERRNPSGFPRFIDGQPGPPSSNPLNDPDDFAFNGSPLIPVCVLGSTTCSVADPPGSGFLTGYTYYRSEIDSFTRFYYSADHAHWEVQLRSGVWMSFGEDFSGDKSSSEVHDLLGPNANSAIYRWNISQITDSWNNHVIYRWAAVAATDGEQPTSSSGVGLKYLTDIYDTPLTNDNGESLIPLSYYAHHTQLFWRGSDTLRTLSPGWKSIPARVLGDVAVTSQTLTNQAQRNIVRLYHLNYSSTAASESRFLQSFEVHGCTGPQSESNGFVVDPATWAYNPVNPQQAPCPTTTPTTLTYTTLPAFSPTLLPPLPSFFTTGSINTGMFDVNGDSVADLVMTMSGPSSTQENTYGVGMADGFAGHTLLQVGPITPVKGPLWAQPGDFLPSAHTFLGNWLGDGQLNWIWYNGAPNYVDPAPALVADIATPASETYSLSPGGSLNGTSPNTSPSPFAYLPSDSILTQGERAEVMLMGQRSKVFDVDGDGLTDMALVPRSDPSPGVPSTNQVTWFSFQGKDGTIMPFRQPTLQPLPQGYTTSAFHAVADMDADGLADIVEVRKSGTGATQEIVFTWWKNRGDGRFGATGTGAATQANQLVVSGAVAESANLDPLKSDLAIGDVNGDGLADFVVLAGNNVYIYGHPPIATYASNSTQAFYLIGEIASVATDGNEAISLADLDGSGMQGVVVSDLTKVSRYKLYAAGPRVGLLATIQSPHMARTVVQYNSVVGLSQVAALGNTPWQTKLPVPAQVVTDVTVSGAFVEPVAAGGDVFDTQYTYTDPIYDARDRTFVGFRVVEESHQSTVGGAVPGAPTQNTTTTYMPGTCPGVAPGVRCTTGVDYGWRIRRGLPITVATTDSYTQALLTTEITQWDYQVTVTGMDGRKSRAVFAQTDDVYQGTNNAASVPGVTVDGLTPVGVQATDGTWAWTGTATIPGAAVDHRRSQQQDVHGNQYVTADWGTVGLDAAIVTQRTWALNPADSSQALYRVKQELTGWGTSAIALAPGARETDYTYEPGGGHLLTVQAPLTGALPLARANPGGSVAGTPLNVSANTTTGAYITLVSYTYDTFGNVTTTKGPSGRCSGTTYDAVYFQLPIAENVYRGGCGVNPLTTTILWDRGLEAVTQVTDPGLAVTTRKYDAYGRLKEVDQPSATTLTMSGSASLLVDWSNADSGSSQGYAVHVTTLDHDSYLVFDNFGRPRYQLSQAETSGSWIVSGGTQLAPNGVTLKAYVPFAWAGAVAPTGLPTVPFAQNNYSSYTYDSWGRPLVSTGPDGNVVSSVTYQPLRTDVMDGEQVGTGVHKGSYTEYQTDGRGQPTSTVRHLLNDPVDVITTTVTRQGTGEITKVQRTHTAGTDSYTRNMTYDSLGRLVLNTEPNTSNVIGSVVNSWRYAYDDAGDLVGTSDARGCGKNLVYDALGRLINEDYSPCSVGTQTSYTAPGTGGVGYETSFTYDTPNLTVGSQGNYAGKLTSTSDRASHTRVAYDARGRATVIQRQIAVPDSPPPVSYAPHWFERDVTYDDANRVASTTPGSDAIVFGATAAPTLVNHYSPRGTISRIDGSYGALLASTAFNPDGSQHQLVLGDIAGTTVDFNYYSTGRLEETHVHRRSGPWTAVSGYLPPASPAVNTLEDDLEDVLLAYDKVGHVTSIQDASLAAWPAGALPDTRAITYDDNYRTRTVNTSYFGTVGAPDQLNFPPYGPEQAAGQSVFPQPAPVTGRVKQQTFAYDWLGNTSASSDDENAFLDRSLGTIVNGANGAGPNQITSAALGGAQLTVAYDGGGNVTTLSVLRPAPCVITCQYTYTYTWDELGQLASATRANISPPSPTSPVRRVSTAVLESYVYDSAGTRVIKEIEPTQAGTDSSYLVDVFPTLQLEGTTFPDANGDYARSAETESVVLESAGMRLGRVVYSDVDPLSSPTGTPHVFLELGDHLGSTSLVIDQETSELVEKPTYLPFGAPESDFRTPRWENFRETTRYTGHEDDEEVGLIYFGHRYYSPLLSRWLSPDPLTIHGLGADLNPYAFVRGGPLSFVDPLGLECNSDNQSCEDDPPPPPPPPCENCSYYVDGGAHGRGPPPQPRQQSSEQGSGPAHPGPPAPPPPSQGTHFAAGYEGGWPGGLYINWWRAIDNTGFAYGILSLVNSAADPGVPADMRLVYAVMAVALSIEPADSLLEFTKVGGLELKFSQTTASPAFSAEGKFAGKTIGSLAGELRSGAVSASDVPVQYVNLGGDALIVNTRSALALTRAGIPQANWVLIDATETEWGNIVPRLMNNGLDAEGTSTIRITGLGSGASNLR